MKTVLFAALVIVSVVAVIAIMTSDETDKVPAALLTAGWATLAAVGYWM